MFTGGSITGRGSLIVLYRMVLLYKHSPCIVTAHLPTCPNPDLLSACSSWVWGQNHDLRSSPGVWGCHLWCWGSFLEEATCSSVVGETPGRKSTAMGLGMQAPSMRQLKFNPGSRIGNAMRKCLNPSVLIFLIRKNRMTI